MTTENTTPKSGKRARMVQADGIYVNVQEGRIIVSALLADVAFCVYGTPDSARALAGYLNRAADMLEAGMDTATAADIPSRLN